jgi:hypothetical protein
MRPRREVLLGLVVLATAVLAAGCDSGTPSGGPLPPGTPTAAALNDLYDVPATITAITIAGSAYPSPVTSGDMKQPADLDACTYLTAEDVRMLTGKAPEQTPRSTNDSKASCTYLGDGNYVTLTIYVLDTIEQTQQLASQSVESTQRYPAYSEFLPGVGDSASVTRYIPGRSSTDQVPKAEEQIGWNVTVTRGRMYLTLKWYSGRFQEKEGIVDLTKRVLSRLK